MFGPYALEPARHRATAAASCPGPRRASRTTLKMEFKMLASTKQISVALAVTLALSTSTAPAFSASAPSNTAMPNPAAPQLRSGDLVRLRSGGPLMTVGSIEGDQVNCVWTDLDSHIASERLPIEALEPGIRILRGFLIEAFTNQGGADVPSAGR
jgi:uncharacterized protein YodC (DUF2158 family)